MSDHERIEELMALEALGALERQDEQALAAELEPHGPECEDCARLRREYGNAAGRLAFALDPVAVPKSMEAEILRRLARPLPARPSPLGRVAAATAAAVLLLLGGVGGYVLAARQEAEQREAAILAAFLARPDVRVIRFEGDQGNLAAAVAPEGGGYLLGADLPTLPRGTVFELWAIRGETPAPRLCVSGGPTLVARFSGDVAGSDALAVTIEPEACSSRPTSDPIFVAPLTA